MSRKNTAKTAAANTASTSAWEEGQAGHFDHVSGKASVVRAGRRWTVQVDGKPLAGDTGATRYFGTAEIAQGVAEDELALPSPRVEVKLSRQAKAKPSRDRKSSSSRKAKAEPKAKAPRRSSRPANAGDLTAGQRAARTKGAAGLSEAARKAAATRRANRLAAAA